MRKMLLLVVLVIASPAEAIKCQACYGALAFYDPCQQVIRQGLERCALSNDPNAGPGCTGSGNFYCHLPIECAYGACDPTKATVRFYFNAGECEKAPGACIAGFATGEFMGIAELLGEAEAIEAVALLGNRIPEDGDHTSASGEHYSTMLVGRPPVAVRITRRWSVTTVEAGTERLLCLKSGGSDKEGKTTYECR